MDILPVPAPDNLKMIARTDLHRPRTRCQKRGFTTASLTAFDALPDSTSRLAGQQP